MSGRKYPKAIETPAHANQIFSKVRQKWVALTPEEKVRQDFLEVLLSEYGYAIEQIAEEEEVTGRGSGHARADFVIWRTVQDKHDSKPPLIVVECKSDNVTIRKEDYSQGDNYARLTNAPFFRNPQHAGDPLLARPQGSHARLPGGNREHSSCRRQR